MEDAITEAFLPREGIRIMENQIGSRSPQQLDDEGDDDDPDDQFADIAQGFLVQLVLHQELSVEAELSAE